MAFNSIEEAVRNVITSNLKSMIPYLLYFYFVINALVSNLGKIEYGDNRPYFIFLVFVGVPYVVCFIHFVLRIYFQEMIIKKSNFEKEKASALIFVITFSVPLIMLLYVQKVLHFANHHPIDVFGFIR
ncbi:hypothetical protein OR1_04101 [Geobacter sp. OR-1]|nr:hypothetical protein OR1_04101 [Geobacter sp. OR-1]